METYIRGIAEKHQYIKFGSGDLVYITVESF